MVMMRVWTTCKSCGKGPIPEEAKKSAVALCQDCFDLVRPDEKELEAEGVLSWVITDVDYFEQDATLHLGDMTYYFQFSDQPTIEAALNYLKYDKGPH